MGIAGMFGCAQTDDAAATDEPAQATQLTGQSGVQDSESSPNVVQIAAGSKDHTTLVKAVQTAGLVDALSNAGPFTVFAPVNAAFDKLPAGTVESLLTPEKKDDLTNILEYHVSVGVYKAESFRDNQNLGQVNGSNVLVKMVDGVPMLNGKAKIIASIPASNGIIHVIDEVLLPQ
jgi:uncharacterized surface protein with fasciclin (FAS1) repeats